MNALRQPAQAGLIMAGALAAWGLASPVTAQAQVSATGPVLYASHTDERYDNGPRWRDDTLDVAWRSPESSTTVGVHQRTRDTTGQEMALRVGHEWTASPTRSHRLSLAAAPDAITLARWGAAIQTTLQQAGGRRVEVETGVRHWPSYTLGEASAAYLQPVGAQLVKLGARGSLAQGQASLQAIAGTSWDTGAWSWGGQVHAGRALSDRSISQLAGTHAAKGLQLQATHTLSDRTWVRLIAARSQDAIGWKSTAALVVSHDFR